jgi:hypothetical protein
MLEGIEATYVEYIVGLQAKLFLGKLSNLKFGLLLSRDGAYVDREHTK